MKENNNKGRGVFYGVIGVATLVVAIIGATFAYFTAYAQNTGTITGNMATIGFSLNVTKIVDPGASTGGMIPMSNHMIEAAGTSVGNTIGDTTAASPCVDERHFAVCQIYQLTVSTTTTSTMLVDGYVALSGGSGEPADFTTATNKTTMRWAQVFPGTTSGTYTTGGTQNLGSSSISMTTPLASNSTTDALNVDNIKTETGDIYSGTASNFTAVKTNFIRVSDHQSGNETFDRTADATSVLVINQEISSANPATFYIMVWLSENGLNQGVGSTETSVASTVDNFFNGFVKFISGDQSEVSATFDGYTAVPKVG